MDPARERLLAALRERAARGSPLTATQQGIWLAEQLDPAVSGYHDTAVLRIEGPLDREVLRRTVEHVRAGHEALRCRLVTDGDEPRQVFDVGAIDWGYVDLSGLSAEGRGARLDRLVTVAAGEPFDLVTGPLWRLRLVRTGAAEHVLVVVVHHLVADGWSHGLLLEALLTGYAALAAAVPPPPGRPGYARWLAERVRREREAAAGGTARVIAADLPAPYRLRLPELDPSVADRAADEIELPIPAADWAAFGVACRRGGGTPFAALTGLFGLLLSQATGQDGVLLSAPVAGRYDERSGRLLGCLINVVPIHLPVSAGDSPAAAAEAGARALGRALRHADLPYRDVVRAARRLPPGDDPLTNVGVEEFNAPVSAVSVGPLRVVPLPRGQVRLRHDLTLTVPAVPGRPVTLCFPRARWRSGRVAALARDLAALIQAAQGETAARHA